MKHIPVLLDRVLETLDDINGKTIVDCTFGAGGYSRAFLERGANVIAFDRDPNVIQDAEKLTAEFGDRFKFILAPFSEITLHDLHLAPYAIVFDFGISSMQIDNGDRGFSFRFDGPLDMRMNAGDVAQGHKGTRAQGSESAAELIENSTAIELAKILREYGDLKKANILANAFKRAIPKTTFELRDLIHNPRDIAPVFQALRIAVNDELGEIERVLDAVPDLLDAGGMCVCVTFHSLEDRIVKQKFRELTAQIGDPRLAGLGTGDSAATPQFKLLKTFTPNAAELADNPRARSAHLRAIVKSY